MIKKMRYILPCLLFLQWLIIKESTAMEKEAEIIMPAAPTAQILATFKETDIPERSVVTGDVELVSADDKTEKVPRSAAELSETLRNLILDIGMGEPLPVTLTGDLFTKLVAILKALNTITAIEPIEYSNDMTKALAPILSKMPFSQMLELLYESNRLDIKPLTWYIIALFATELDQNKNLSVVSTLTKTLADRHKDMSNLTAKMLEAILPDGKLAWELSIPVVDLKQLAVKAVPRKGIIALTGTETSLFVWNLTESVEKMQKELEHAAPASTLDISDDGTRALVVLRNGMLQVWDLETGSMRRQIKSSAGVIFAALSDDGKYVLANLAEGTVDLWDLENDTVKPLVQDYPALLKFSPDARYALVGLRDNTMLYVNIENGQALKVLRGHTGMLASAAFSNDGKFILTGAYDNIAILWNLTQEGKQLKPVRIFEGRFAATATAISPDNNYALTGAWLAYLWDLKSAEKPLAIYMLPVTKVSSVAFSPDGKLGIIGSVLPGGGLRPEVNLWSLSKEHTLPEVILFIKLNQLGKGKVLEEPYFKNLYDTFFGYLEKSEESIKPITISPLTEASPKSGG